MKARKMFVGSSTGYIELARAFRMTFEHDQDLEVEVWEVTRWREMYDSLTVLIEHLDSFQFGVFLLTPDDIIGTPGQTKSAPRDNVILELGLWLGRAGRDRTWYLAPRNVPLKLPSDLEGLNTLKYDLPTNNEYKQGSASKFVGRFATPHDRIIDNIRAYQQRAAEPSFFFSQIRRLQEGIRGADDAEAIKMVVDGIRGLLLERSVLSRMSVIDTLRDVLIWTRTLLDGLDSEQLAEVQGKTFDAVWVFAPEPIETTSADEKHILKKTVARNIFENRVKYVYFVHDDSQISRIRLYLRDIAKDSKVQKRSLSEFVSFVKLPEPSFLSYFTLHFCREEIIVYQSVVRDNRDDFIVRLDENRARVVKRLIEMAKTTEIPFDEDLQLKTTSKKRLASQKAIPRKFTQQA